MTRKLLFNSAIPFPWLLHFTLDPLLYNTECYARLHQVPFLSLLYDSCWDRIPVSPNIGSHSTHKTNGYVISDKCMNVILFSCRCTFLDVSECQDQKQSLSHLYYYRRWLCWWSHASLKYTCPDWILLHSLEQTVEGISFYVNTIKIDCQS